MLGKIKEDEREEMPDGAVVLERVVSGAPEKVTLRRKLKERSRVEECDRGAASAKAPRQGGGPAGFRTAKRPAWWSRATKGQSGPKGKGLLARV